MGGRSCVELEASAKSSGTAYILELVRRHHSSTVVACHSTAGVHRRVYIHTYERSCAGDTAAHTEGGDEMADRCEHEEEVLSSSALDGHDAQAYDQLRAGARQACQRFQEACLVQISLAPAVCSAQPADGGCSSCRLGVLLGGRVSPSGVATSRIPGPPKY